ncbi:hypothetical protein [Martelella sp. HB161492]|uniref:hypothetical protein n=1 Tax=Martelella sp. HB161492 TaxID=2720726 RepID=UPI0015908144|nr:hypothetical protein [Martelella sp. HB161492]
MAQLSLLPRRAGSHQQRPSATVSDLFAQASARDRKQFQFDEAALRARRAAADPDDDDDDRLKNLGVEPPQIEPEQVQGRVEEPSSDEPEQVSGKAGGSAEPDGRVDHMEEIQKKKAELDEALQQLSEMHNIMKALGEAQREHMNKLHEMNTRHIETMRQMRLDQWKADRQLASATMDENMRALREAANP